MTQSMADPMGCQHIIIANVIEVIEGFAAEVLFACETAVLPTINNFTSPMTPKSPSGFVDQRWPSFSDANLSRMTECLSHE